MQKSNIHPGSVLLCLLVSAAAGAAEVRFDGSYRFRINGDTNLSLDDTDFRSAQKTWAEHRLRITPKIVEIGGDGGIEVQSSFDIVSGVIAGDVAANFRGYGLVERSEKNGLKAQGFDFRYLFAKLRTNVGIIEVGQMPSHWGMGMLANDGNGEHISDFGDPHFGDIVDGGLFATRPLVGVLGPKSEFAQQLALAVAANVVYRDRYADLVVRTGDGLEWGDVAWQGIAALIWDPSDRTRAGLYVTRRVQTFDNDQGDLHVWIVDGHLRHSSNLGNWIWSFEGEAAGITGGTSHAPNLAAPGTTHVGQFGAAVRTGLAHNWFETELEGGYASGDANPFDDKANAFQMNRDYNVSLILFEQVMMFQTQNAARRLSDPGLLGSPPQGLDMLPSEGAVTNAYYLKPTVRFKPRIFGGGWRLVGAALFAQAPQPVLDPFHALVSSSAKNSYGYDAGRNYGVEVDGALSWQTKISGTFGFESGVQYGYLFPGDAFTRADGSRMPGVHALRIRATFVF